MSVAVSLPGLVSQRQCKVTARPTRASRCRHVCNGPQPPFPAQRPAPHPPRPRPISRCLSVRFSILAHAAPTVAAATFRRATYFFVQRACSFYAASLLTLRHTVLHSVSRIKSVVPTPKSQMGDIELLMFIIAPIGIHSSATLLFCHRR